MSDVFFEILSPLPLNRHQDARKLFQLWADNAFQFLPDRWGLYEPLRHQFSSSSLEQAIRTWEFDFLVKRTARPRLGKPGMAERMFAAIERGSKVNLDLSDKWDYWAWIELPIDEVRQRLNILPKA